VGKGAAGRWSGVRVGPGLGEVALVVAASGSLMLVSALVAVTQTVWVLDVVGGSDAGVVPGRRMVANLVWAAGVAGALVALGLHRHRVARQVTDVLLAGMVAALLRLAAHVALGVHPLAPHDSWLLQLGAGLPMAWLAGGLAVASLWVLRRVRGDAAETVRSALERAEAMRALEDEEVRVRREVAEGLHGTAQQRLVLVVAGLDRLLADADGTAELATLAVLRDLREKVETVRGGDIRKASRLLYPYQIEVGLVPAVRSMLDEVPAAVRTQLTVDPGVRALDGPGDCQFTRGERLLVARVVEEALGNALRHGRASAVEVTIERDGCEVVATVRDDGCGFDEPTPSGSGLARLSERLRLVGGELTARPAAGGGVVVRARLLITALQAGAGEGRLRA